MCVWSSSSQDLSRPLSQEWSLGREFVAARAIDSFDSSHSILAPHSHMHLFGFDVSAVTSS